jgi:hypothetical protein
MKIARRFLLVLCVSVLLACSWLAPLDAPAMAQVDAGLKRALVSFASARALNGLLSVVQAAQVDIQPAGVGVTLSPGQIVAPVNELVKSFADMMLLACVAFGIQKVLISISSYWVVSGLLSLVTLAWTSCQLRQNAAPRWLSSALVLMVMLRFAIPVALVATDSLSQKFLAADYTVAQSALDATTIEASKTKVPEPATTDDKSWLPKVPTWVPSLQELKDRFTRMQQAVEHSTENMVKLMVVFLLQTLLLPLLMVWGLWALARATVK